MKIAHPPMSLGQLPEHDLQRANRAEFIVAERHQRECR